MQFATGAHRHGAAAMRRAEVAWAFIICATILAFMPLVPRAGVLSLDASPSRIMELGLLALALAMALVRAPPSKLIEVASRNVGLFLVVGSFAIWAALTGVIAGRSPTGIVKAAELAAVLLIALASKGDPELPPASVPRAIAVAVLAATTILLAANILIYRELVPMLPTEGQSRVRLMLGFNHPLASALLLAVGMIAVLHARFRLPVLVASECLLLSLFLLCDARGLTAGVMAGGLAAIWLAARPAPRAALTLVVLVAASAGLLFLALEGSYLKLLKFGGSDGITLNGRIEVWRLVLQVAAEHPLSGIGYFNIRYHILTAFDWSGSAHNSFLEILAGTGLPGAALFLAFTLIWIGRIAAMRDSFLVVLSPVVLIEGMLNSILLVPTFAFLVLLIALAKPLQQSGQHAAREAVLQSRDRQGSLVPVAALAKP